jgi:hypothetical protein
MINSFWNKNEPSKKTFGEKKNMISSHTYSKPVHTSLLTALLQKQVEKERKA